MTMLFAFGTACKVLSTGDEVFGGKGDDAGGDWLLLVLIGVPGVAGVVLVSWLTDCNVEIDGTVGTGLEHAMFMPLPNWITSEMMGKEKKKIEKKSKVSVLNNENLMVFKYPHCLHFSTKYFQHVLKWTQPLHERYKVTMCVWKFEGCFFMAKQGKMYI